MSLRARTKPVKIRTLRARMEYLQTVIGGLEPGDKRGPWLRAEAGALEWALPILEGYVYGPNNRRQLPKHRSTTEDLPDEEE